MAKQEECEKVMEVCMETLRTAQAIVKTLDEMDLNYSTMLKQRLRYFTQGEEITPQNLPNGAVGLVFYPTRQD